MISLPQNLEIQKQESIFLSRGQEFHRLRETCLTQSVLYEDPFFDTDPKYTWKRPYEITDDPRLFVDGASRHDVVQGSLGNCWLVASISALATQLDLLRRVIPEDQSFVDRYAGIFHFRLWYFGNWYDIVIDDRLPVDEHGSLAFVHSKQENEFWAALLEKAYSKMYGGFYHDLEEGHMCEGLKDFTGGVVEYFYMENVPKNFNRILLNSFLRRSLMGCSIDANDENERQRPDGLTIGHVYAITCVKHFNLYNIGNITLIRIRNLWGNVVWNGPWSDGSPEWRIIPDYSRKEIGLVYENEGEFWMSYSDFITCWNRVEMCHLTPDTLEHSVNKTLDWHMNLIVGSWVRGLTDGGIANMHLNPQVRLTVSHADDSDEDGFCSVLIALMQRVKMSMSGERFSYNFICASVYKINQYRYLDNQLDKYFFMRNNPVSITGFRASREVAGRFDLLPGHYCIIPHTYDDGKEGEFLLRVFTEKRHNIHQLGNNLGLKSITVGPSDVELKEKDQSEEDEELKNTKLLEIFNRTTGGEMEADWRQLKHILDLVLKNETSINIFKPNFLIDILTYIFHIILHLFFNFFIGKPIYFTAFETIGPGGFSKELCRSMIALLDMDHSGKLNFQEFLDLWSGIKKWKSIYEEYSNESKGILTSCQLKEAFISAGFQLNNKILGDLVHRYCNKDGNISFDDFLICALKLTSMSKYFNFKDNENKEKAEFTLQEFIRKTLYS